MHYRKSQPGSTETQDTPICEVCGLPIQMMIAHPFVPPDDAVIGLKGHWVPDHEDGKYVFLIDPDTADNFHVELWSSEEEQAQGLLRYAVTVPMRNHPHTHIHADCQEAMVREEMRIRAKNLAIDDEEAGYYDEFDDDEYDDVDYDLTKEVQW